MKTVLVISNSAEKTEYDLERSINTIKGYGMDPLAVMPAIFETDGTSGNFDVTEMLDYVFDECEASAVNIGYITDPDIYVKIASKLKERSSIPVVLRASVISATGALLVNEDAYYALLDEVLPLASFVVVNCLEAELLSESECSSKADYEAAARKIRDTYGCQVMILGGEKTSGETLICGTEDTSWIFCLNRSSGSDKDISTAVACGMADGNTPSEAAAKAFEYVYGPVSTKPKVDLGNLRSPSPFARRTGLTVKKEEGTKELSVRTEGPSRDLSVKPEPGVKLPSLNRTAVPDLSRFSFSLKSRTGSDKEDQKTDNGTSEAKAEESKPDPAASSKPSEVNMHNVSGDHSNPEPAKPAATSSSLVSPAKSLREMARRIDAEHHIQKDTDQKGVTSSIKDALDAKRSEVVDITSPVAKYEREVGKPATDLQALKDRLSRLSGEG